MKTNEDTVGQRKCSVEGCEKEYSCRGWCQMHYRRWSVHGDPLYGNRAGYIEDGVGNIPLTRGEKALVDADDYGWLSQWKWHAWIGGGKKYACRHNGKKTIRMHSLIMGFPKYTDHINGNGLDNRRDNLRIATASGNAQNRKPISKSGFKGVFYYNCTNRIKRWRAYITANGKEKSLGLFHTAEDAAIAYDKAAKELHGEFAYLNFPDRMYENPACPDECLIYPKCRGKRMSCRQDSE